MGFIRKYLLYLPCYLTPISPCRISRYFTFPAISLFPFCHLFFFFTLVTIIAFIVQPAMRTVHRLLFTLSTDRDILPIVNAIVRVDRRNRKLLKK